MSVNFGSNYNTQSINKKQKKSNEMKAIYGGLLTSSAISTSSIPISKFIENKFHKNTKPKNISSLRTVLTEAIKKSGTGVEIVDLSIDKSIAEDFSELLKRSNPVTKFLIEQTNTVYQASQGKNAAFTPLSNQIYIDLEKMGNSVFHEIGHAINFNTSKILKSIQLCRPLFLFGASVPALIAILKKPKQEGEKPQVFFDKATTFIKNNAGKLAMLMSIPVLAEEMIATSKGNKLAKEFLNPENYKNIVKANKLGAISYCLIPLFAGISAWASNKIADKIRS